MKYTVCENFEWTYPDVHKYATSADTARCYTLLGGIASFQIHAFDCGDSVTVSTDIPSAELYEEIAIPVESCPGIEPEDQIPHFPERQALFLVNDCLKPCDGSITLKNGSLTLYVSVNCNTAGIITGSVTLSDSTDSAVIPVEITVSDVPLPPEKLEILMGFSRHCMAINHKANGRSEFLRLEDEYLAMLRRMHQNRLYIDTPQRRRGTDGKVIYDFTENDRYVKKALEMGFHSFHLPDVGYRSSWESDEIKVGGKDYRSPEGQAHLKAYLGALRRHIYEMGWSKPEMFSIGVADEPNELNSPGFVELSHMVKKLIPEMSIYDAVADTDIDDAAIDIWVPRSDQYERGMHRFEKLRSRATLWHYVCLFPREPGYVNRFMDIPLLCTRYLYWGNFRYSMPGYLHWTVNDYQGGCDPFEKSCPEHINAGSKSILPPGDDKLIYPGDGHPWMSMRLENHRESAEEYSMLCVIAEKHPEKAMDICQKVMRSFKDTELDPAKFALCRRELIAEYENCLK